MNERPSGPSESTEHIRRAAGGDIASTTWVIERFTPLLLAQARHRITPGLRHLLDPRDLVQDVWAIALPRLGDIEADGGTHAATLARFLSTTLLNRYRNLLKRHLRSKRGDGAQGGAPLEELPARTSGIVTRQAREERHDRLRQALAMLTPEEREVVILRGIEQTPAREAAAILGLVPNTLTVRYRRALGRLRGILGESVFDELDDQSR